MNDQMYKQNRRVMSNEYGQSLMNQRADKTHKPSVKISRISSVSNDFLEYQSASSVISENIREPFLKRFYRNVVKFFFSQVLSKINFDSKNRFKNILGWRRLFDCWLHNSWGLYVPGHRDLWRLPS